MIVSMSLTISIFDESNGGPRRDRGAIEWPTASITLREIIRTRVQNEVEIYNQQGHTRFQGLIQPEEAERLLNGVRPSICVMNADEQYAKAIATFERQGFVVLIGERQIHDLDEPLEIQPQAEVTFLRLVPLIGG
jgi:hypothetical protein